MWYQDEISFSFFHHLKKHLSPTAHEVKWKKAHDFDVWFSLQINKFAWKRFMSEKASEKEQIENVKEISNIDLSQSS